MNVMHRGAPDPDPQRDWNQTQRDYPSDQCLHRLIEQQVRRTPDKVAVVCEGRTLTYAELDCEANSLARRLVEKGVGPDVLVGICIDRKIEMLVGMLGILKAGGAYVPIDPSYPKDRIQFMLDDSQSGVLVTEASQLDTLSSGDCEVIVLDEINDPATERDTTAIDTQAKPNHLAYVIYTSGSTGKPKGVQITHRALVNFLNSMQREPGMTSDDVMFAVTTLSFDIAGLELFLPLIAGGCVEIASGEVSGDVIKLTEALEHSDATIMQATPATWRMLIETGWRGRKGLKVLCGGEAMPQDIVAPLVANCGELWNMYGPTETTVWSSIQRINSADGVITIGRPIDNTQMYILDESLNLVPTGVSGELYIGGDGLARGYLDRPELTSERFIPNPFGEPDAHGEPSERIYKTGDLARFQADGQIECLGRIDHQVKIRGFRIELGEIETLIMQHPDVRLAAVTAREYGPGDRRLVAYLVPAGAMPTGQEDRGKLIRQVRRSVQEKLPDYMTPSLWMLLSELPMTANGKLDRQSLPEPPRSRPELDQPLVLPRSDLERRLADKWQELLQLEQIGIHDRFFELGGDSLRAAVFVNWLQETLDEVIFVVTIFQAPTIAEFAELLQRDYSKAVNRWLGVESVPSAADGTMTAEPTKRRLDQTRLRQMRDLVPKMKPTSESVGKKNPRAVFILAPPRSGTTLLRVMLAGHPGLFAATELQLLCFHTLAERKAAFAGKHAAWLEGAIRAIMELRQCDAEEAKAIMQDHEDRQLTTKDFYCQLQQWAQDRLLIDKSPHYALDEHALRKAELDFAEPFYIHLVRHPYAMVRSFEKHHMDQILYLKEHDFSARELGEAVWTVSHQNILEFFEQVPQSRQHRISFEQLTQQPDEVMRHLTAALDIEFHADLLNPYADQKKKMVDGIYDASMPMGDVNFLRHNRIDAEVADRWKAVEQDDFLGETTWQLAQQLGYQRGESGDREESRWSQQKTAAQGRRQQLSQRRAKRTRTRAE